MDLPDSLKSKVSQFRTGGLAAYFKLKGLCEYIHYDYYPFAETDRAMAGQDPKDAKIAEFPPLE